MSSFQIPLSTAFTSSLQHCSLNEKSLTDTLLSHRLHNNFSRNFAFNRLDSLVKLFQRLLTIVICRRPSCLPSAERQMDTGPRTDTHGGILKLPSFGRKSKKSTAKQLHSINNGARAVPKSAQEKGPVLKNLKVTAIKPHPQTEHDQYVELSRFDLVGIDGYIPIIFLYKLGDNSPITFSHIVNQLKESLSRVLIKFYPMAGRWLKTNDTLMRTLLCEDQGVPFIEAYIDDDLNKIVDINDFQPIRYLSGYEALGLDLDATNFHQNWEVPLPAAIVQVTNFRCGGLALVVTLSHTNRDGTGMTDFMEAWVVLSQAMASRAPLVPPRRSSVGESIRALIPSRGTEGEAYIHQPPRHSSAGESSLAKRSITIPGISLEASFRKPSLEDMFKSQNYAPDLAIRTSAEHGLAYKVLKVNPSVIEEMKKEVPKMFNDVQFATTVDCISAHLWRCLSKIPKELGGSDVTTIWTVVDGRKRTYTLNLDPKYRSANRVMGARFPQLTASQLLSQPRAFAVRLVHKSVRQIHPASLKELMAEALEFALTPQAKKLRHFMLSSWIRFPFYFVDFGFGSPYFACCNGAMQTAPFGCCCILPPPPSPSPLFASAATVQITMQQSDLKALLRDPEFLSMFL